MFQTHSLHYQWTIKTEIYLKPESMQQGTVCTNYRVNNNMNSTCSKVGKLEQTSDCENTTSTPSTTSSSSGTVINISSVFKYAPYKPLNRSATEGEDGVDGPRDVLDVCRTGTTDARRTSKATRVNHGTSVFNPHPK